MKPVESVLEVVEAVAPIAHVTPATCVGIPPSDADADEEKMRVAHNGVIILRAYDPTI